MKKIFFLISISFFAIQLFSQNVVGFFKAETLSDDTSTISLTEDLYFSKASLLSEITVVDYRTSKFNFSEINSYKNINYVFFPEIQEYGDGWKCIFHGIKVQNKSEFTFEKEYESYYMILMNAKKDLSEFFASLNKDNTKQDFFENADSTSNSYTGNLDSLSGTWQGEKYIDKIIILRGGRGFVIFQNGASMNISIKIDGNTFTATQTGNASASFFPEINREQALINAASAEPIKWTLEIINNSTMEGKKYTLTQEGENIFFSTIPVKWKRL
ncbi:MAG: TP0183 family DNA metabolism protein [Treponemataceae bacterium]